LAGVRLPIAVSHAQKIGVSIITTVGVTAVASFIALQAAGIGLGSYIPAALLFPFALLAAFVIHHADWLLMKLALSQFPIYRLVLGRAWLRGRLPSAAVSVTVVHVLAALGCTAAMMFASG
jgi:hypothetical protein